MVVVECAFDREKLSHKKDEYEKSDKFEVSVLWLRAEIVDMFLFLTETAFFLLIIYCLIFVYFVNSLVSHLFSFIGCALRRL